MDAAVELSIAKHSVRIGDKATSFSLEDEFWQALKVIATEDDLTVAYLVNHINNTRGNRNLSSAIRIYILKYYQGDGHARRK